MGGSRVKDEKKNQREKLPKIDFAGTSELVPYLSLPIGRPLDIKVQMTVEDVVQRRFWGAYYDFIARQQSLFLLAHFFPEIDLAKEGREKIRKSAGNCGHVNPPWKYSTPFLSFSVGQYDSKRRTVLYDAPRPEKIVFFPPDFFFLSFFA